MKAAIGSDHGAQDTLQPLAIRAAFRVSRSPCTVVDVQALVVRVAHRYIFSTKRH